ncbi:DNA-3-methyladenine glycosylase 2 family protein [Modestobacter sp. I12A-02628]|uniref:DNA-3-methyladenine glycosylase 2 family protein n=1 Tax=Goekera deserti TaxID=2497753 RepID=A0A7K3W9Q0_9ACTN|nr:DNA-3-methyladenine glycosylase 2 family protein [Goekera deserti]MPQ98872.1 DNA-3-methyladenine glycosylase 2 family protein [Goekera deserti]NDI49629.1 DNA-3-methyladenine glycosylase 2 family protein [Goekera deserti]NEL53178.1 DNA-3-methyladenine glycosylase 2 family protein [Goekera deserti]
MTTLTLPTGDVDLGLTLAPFTMLTRDPTLRLAPGRFERASPTPEGPGTVVVTWDGTRPEARVETHGDGAAWLADRAPDLLGLRDDATGFDPAEGPLRALWRRHRGDRIAATGTLWHDLAWFVVQQRVTRGEAAAQWSRLVRGLGTPAPGAEHLVVLPPPAVVARLGYADLHRFGIERQRADTLVTAARAAHRLHTEPVLDRDAALAALGAVRGVGPWTTSCLATSTFGDPDTVITGDASIPSLVAWVLAGERRADDARLHELLAPHRPHRYRVIRLAFASGARPPRHGARTAPHDVRRR